MNLIKRSQDDTKIHQISRSSNGKDTLLSRLSGKIGYSESTSSCILRLSIRNVPLVYMLDPARSVVSGADVNCTSPQSAIANAFEMMLQNGFDRIIWYRFYL